MCRTHCIKCKHKSFCRNCSGKHNNDSDSDYKSNVNCTSVTVNDVDQVLTVTQNITIPNLSQVLHFLILLLMVKMLCLDV
jgi:hypothetical protein